MINFLQKFEDLRKSIPIPAVRSGENEACDHMDYGAQNHRCSFCFVGMQLEDSIYCSFSGLSHYIVDCEFCVSCNYCYESFNSMYCYQSTYLYDSTKCRDCHFCSMCIDCNNCYGCVALTHKEYCIFNKQYSPSEYKEKVVQLQKQPFAQTYTQFLDLVKKTPYPQTLQRNNENCQYGDYLSYSKNVYWGFNTYWLENSGYIYSGALVKNCWDLYASGGGSAKDMMAGGCEWSYECVGAWSLYHCAYLYQSGGCMNCYYGWDLRNCSDCFGCVALTNKQYCILNNQFTKEKYFELVKQIREELGWSTLSQ